MSQESRVQTIIVSRPGVMQESLRAGLTSLPQIEIVNSVGDGLSALDLIRELQPNLVVIDSNLLQEEILALLRHIKQEWPAVSCLVLTESSRQEKWATDSGADAIWPRHRSTRYLNELLPQICSGL